MLLKRHCGNPNSKELVRCWRTIYSVCTQEDVYDVEGLICQVNNSFKNLKLHEEHNRVSILHQKSSGAYDIKFDEQIQAMLGMSEMTVLADTPITSLKKADFGPFFGHGQQRMYRSQGNGFHTYYMPHRR
ncbi:unnamed protein product [Orchesella dallaii]|uniref:Uncharacterized protein n=1 Tax=Orchesella dallaii TaxID=48710 RepID=A0ABP1PZD7_9HEXA